MSILDRYITLFQELTPETLDALVDCVDDTIFFKDPFNEVEGKALFRRIFSHMFAHVDDPRFVVSLSATTGDGAFLAWTMTGRTKNGSQPFSIEGVSLIHVGEGGLITRHVDYWDPTPSIYNAIPFLGSVMRLIRRRLSISLP